MLLALLLTCLPQRPLSLDFTHPPPGWEGAEWPDVLSRARHFAWLGHELMPTLAPECLEAHALVRLAEGQPEATQAALWRAVRSSCGPTGGHVAQLLAEEALGP